ncbi:hypothetical protein CCP3SC1AL1_70010 [Gammaproteobacteria bacterium]
MNEDVLSIFKKYYPSIRGLLNEQNQYAQLLNAAIIADLLELSINEQKSRS